MILNAVTDKDGTLNTKLPKSLWGKGKIGQKKKQGKIKLG